MVHNNTPKQKRQGIRTENRRNKLSSAADFQHDPQTNKYKLSLWDFVTKVKGQLILHGT